MITVALFILSLVISSGFIYLGYVILFRMDLLVRLFLNQYEEVQIGKNKGYISENVSSPYGQFCGMKIKLAKRLPNIVLESRSNDTLKGSTPFLIDKNQRFDLEGDFNNFFDFYTVQKSVSFALSVLTPDIMALLVDEATIADVIIHDKYLYLVLKDKKMTVEMRHSLINVASELLTKVNHRIESWSAEDEERASQIHLTFIQDEHFKLSRSRVSSGYIAFWVGCLFIGAAFWLSTYFSWRDSATSTPLKVYCLIVALLTFPIAPLVFPLFRKYLLKDVHK